jgi:hypothetical protein
VEDQTHSTSVTRQMAAAAVVVTTEILSDLQQVDSVRDRLPTVLAAGTALISSSQLWAETSMEVSRCPMMEIH